MFSTPCRDHLVSTRCSECLVCPIVRFVSIVGDITMEDADVAATTSAVVIMLKKRNEEDVEGGGCYLSIRAEDG
jgi:hypothetical protein